MSGFRPLGIDWVVGRVLDCKSSKMCGILDFLEYVGLCDFERVLDSPGPSLSVCCILNI